MTTTSHPQSDSDSSGKSVDAKTAKTMAAKSSSVVESQARLASQVQHLSHLTSTLGQEKHFLRAALDSAEDALIAFDVNGTFALCNSGFEQLFDLRATDLAGHDEAWLRARLANRLVAPDDFFHQPPVLTTPAITTPAIATPAIATPQIETAENAAHAESKTFQIELKPLSRTDSASNEHAENESFHVAAQGEAQGEAQVEARILRWYSGPVRDGAHRLVGHIATQRDITRETQVDRMKTDFIAIVSHELRTPMTSIKGYVDLILDGDTGEINGLQRSFLSTVQRNTRRLVAMINDMLDISRIESGGIDFDLRPFSLRAVIDQALEIMKPQADEKHLQIEVVFDHGNRAPRVLADFDRVLQVLTNLLSNAVKYTPAPPHEYSSPGAASPNAANRIEIEVHADEARARVVVRDRGIGISPEDQAQLFQKFFRADNSVTREVAGTGLGLPITRALIEKMGGELAVRSEAGMGSEFSFTLPLSSESRGAEENDEEASHILVVDDDPDIVDLISLFLQRNGYRTTAAYSGPEALRLIAQEPFDAVTLDVLMPHMDGFSVLRQLRDNAGTQTIPVIVVSVDNSPQAANAQAEHDADASGLRLVDYDFIAKPFDERVLHATLERVLSRNANERGAKDDALSSTFGAPVSQDDAAPASVHAASSVASQKQPDGGLRALVVDGEGDLAGEISGLLEAQGAQVVVAATPAEALSQARERPVHLVIMNPLAWGDQTLQLVESLREESESGAPFLLFTEPDARGQYVLSRLSDHIAPSTSASPGHEYSSSETEPRALRDLCARLDEILHHHSPTFDKSTLDK